MASADSISPLTGAPSPPLASIRAYRKTGCAVVTVERQGRIPHRYRVSLRRYAAPRAAGAPPALCCAAASLSPSGRPAPELDKPQGVAWLFYFCWLAGVMFVTPTAESHHDFIFFSGGMIFCS